jgi:glycosyltransferase involved in cell wall biosynthesis
MPLVSVVIPTHNRPEMLAEAVASVRMQTFTDYEIIVVSNGENDDMRRASRKVAAAHDSAYSELDDGNVCCARNTGVERANGEWIAFLDDDDLWLANKLERQVTEAERTGADLIACDYVKFFPDGREIIERPRLHDGWSYVRALSHQYWWAPPSATMVRRRVLEEIGGFDPRQLYSEDTDVWRRISWSHTIHQMDEVLVRYRQGHGSLMQHERRLYLYDVRHYFKMRRDTPRHLRSALPPAATFLAPRLIGILSPDWFLRWLHGVRPRTRWIQFHQWLRLRTYGVGSANSSKHKK